MNILLTIIISTVTVFASLWGAYNHLPLEFLEKKESEFLKLGATITTINGTDTISSSRTVINDNFTALNNGKIENSSTSIAAITTLSNLSSIGTISTGVWNGTTISGTYGGTGTTSPSQYQILLGNGSYGITIASSTGSSGQFLTSNGTGAYPSWQNSAVSQSLDYYWTSAHNFTGSATRIQAFHASSTAANPLVLNGVSINTPNTQGASSSVFANDGSGNLISSTETGWHKLKELTADVATGTMGIIQLPARSEYEIIINIVSVASAGIPRIRFNLDSGTTYGYTVVEDAVRCGSGGSGCNSTDSILALAGTSTTSPAYYKIHIHNEATLRKMIEFRGGSSPSAAIAPINYTGVGVWNNTADSIRDFQLITGGGNFGAGTKIKIYGKN